MANYNVGDIVIVHGTAWAVKSHFTSKADGSPAVSLVNPDNPNHATAFLVSVLDQILADAARADASWAAAWDSCWPDTTRPA